ncbi:MAG: flagellar biosynthetic protein FliO [Spirochaetota bacterium]|nr:flagellar biosynthetic protein FliO [Spirochaetota bacterium]
MKNVFIIIVVSVVLVITAAPAWSQAEDYADGNQLPAQVNEEELPIQDTQAPEIQLEEGLNTFTIWDFLRMVLVLGGVIAAIYGIFYLLKRVGNPKSQPNNLITVLTTQNLQGSRALHLIEVGNEVYLVGSSDGGVNLVSRIEDGETLDQIRLYRSEVIAGGKSFQQTLKGFFHKGGVPETDDSMQDGALFLQKQRERLKNM